MIVRYSSLNRLEKPKFTLCSPGSIYENGVPTHMVGMLVDTEAEEIVFNFDATSELNLRVNRIRRESNEDNNYVYRIYKAVQNRRLLFVDDVGYFMITNVEDGFDGSMHFKDVKAKSIDIEIAQKMVPYIENGTYKFTSDETGTNKGIIETVVETLPLWTIGHVDDSVAEKYRTFEDVDTSTNCLSFLLQNIQDAYECIVVFDNINRIINVYAQDNYVRETEIHITQDDLINSLDITENADDLYTAVTVLGNDNVTISAINPVGSNTLYDFSYYYDWMSDDLGTKVRAWHEEVEDERQAYYDLNLEYFTHMAEIVNFELEIGKLDTQIKMYTRCRENIVADSSSSAKTVENYNKAIVEDGGEPITIYEEVEDILVCIDNLISECESQQDNVRSRLKQATEQASLSKSTIDSTNDRLSIMSYFTEEEYTELCHYIYEGSYTDDYVVITDVMTYDEKFAQMKTLYDRARSQLMRVAKPTQEFSVDVENFIFIKEFERWSEQLETGCLINVEVAANDIAMLFLSNMTINYDDHSLKMTFGNRFNKFDTKSLFNDVLGKITKSANTLSYIKEIVYPIKSGEFNSMQEALQSSRDLTMGQAFASTNEEVVIDGSGYTGRKMLSSGVYDPRQVKLTGRSLVFTDDAWLSSKVAIGEIQVGDGQSTYGINAKTLIGDMILGNNIRILDSDGKDLFTAVDGMIKSSVRDIEGDVSQLTEMIHGSDGILIRVQSLENQNNVIDSVTTTTGYTFNADGLTIYKEGEEIKSLLDNTGMRVTRSDAEVLTANNIGVNAINLTARQYLIVGGNSRFEDYMDETGEKRTACFYIGG